MKKIPPILIAVHSLLNSDGTSVHGTGSSLPKLFHKSKIPWVRIQLPIYGGAAIRVEKELAGKFSRKYISKPTSTSLTNKSWHELVTVLAYTHSFETIGVYIGIDPLNALFGILAKRLYKNINSVVYYTADYAHMRFENKFANHVYHAIDKFVLHNADQVWNVSTKIYELRNTQGVPEGKNFFIPNTPLLDQIPSKRVGQKKNTHDMIIVGTSISTLDYEMLLRALPKIIKKYPDARLCVVGELHFSQLFMQKIEPYVVSGHIKLFGSQDHKTVLKLLLKSGIGLAPYTRQSSWTEFGDSMKIREYLACGLPVITTKVVSTSDIIREFDCGKIVSATADSFIRALEVIWNKKNYTTYARNAKKASLAYDTARMLKVPLSKLGVNL
jgi:glycosyltransferase involved in cell wall biosynthesis